MGRPLTPLLSKEKIVDAAMAIVDQDGVPAMTTRAIAKSLNVGQASLYNHFGDRDELLDLLNERVLSEMDVTPIEHPDWRTAVLGQSVALLEAMQRHPNMVVVIATRPARSDPSLNCYELMHARLAEAGVSLDEASRYLFAVDDYCIGAALNTATTIEVEGREEQYPLVAAAEAAPRPVDHHRAALKMFLDALDVSDRQSPER